MILILRKYGAQDRILLPNKKPETGNRMYLLKCKEHPELHEKLNYLNKHQSERTPEDPHKAVAFYYSPSDQLQIIYASYRPPSYISSSSDYHLKERFLVPDLIKQINNNTKSIDHVFLLTPHEEALVYGKIEHFTQEDWKYIREPVLALCEGPFCAIQYDPFTKF